MEKYLETVLVELNKFNNILFFEQGHKYIDINTDSQLESVTTKLKKLQEPFKAEYWSVYKALQANGYTVKSDKSKNVPENHIMINDSFLLYTELSGDSSLFLTASPSSIRNQWKHEGLIGRTRGTLTHYYLENKWGSKILKPNISLSFIKTQSDLDDFVKSVTKCYRMADQFMKDHPNLIPVRLEFVVGDSELGYAGQVDAIFYDLNTKLLHLYDYKTDKKINRTNRFSKFYPPFNHLDDCEFNKYSLQVSMYKYILEKNTNLEFGSSYIVWIYHENDTYELIKLAEISPEKLFV